MRQIDRQKYKRRKWDKRIMICSDSNLKNSDRTRDIERDVWNGKNRSIKTQAKERDEHTNRDNRNINRNTERLKIAQFKKQMKERNNRNRNTDRLKLLNSNLVKLEKQLLLCNNVCPPTQKWGDDFCSNFCSIFCLIFFGILFELNSING